MSVIDTLYALPGRVDSIEARMNALEAKGSDAPPSTLEHAVVSRAVQWRQGRKASADETALVDAIDRLLLARKQEELR